MIWLGLFTVPLDPRSPRGDSTRDHQAAETAGLRPMVIPKREFKPVSLPIEWSYRCKQERVDAP
jgi:hypothetical protein